MKLVMVVMAFTWLAWFPFFLFDTDWVGREVYHGSPRGASAAEATLYQLGVRTGALGLLLNSIVQGITSLLVRNCYMLNRFGRTRTKCLFGLLDLLLPRRRKELVIATAV
jgi:hypothetical protein